MCKKPQARKSLSRGVVKFDKAGTRHVARERGKCLERGPEFIKIKCVNSARPFCRCGGEAVASVRPRHPRLEPEIC